MNLRSIRFTSTLWTMLAALIAASPTVHSAEEDFSVDVHTVAKNTSVSFVVTAEGSPAPNFQWLKDGVMVPGATGTKLELGMVSASSAGVYNALAVNNAGWSLSNDLVLIVDEPATAPVFTSHPVSSTELPGSSITMSASSTGSPVPTYQWRKNGQAIPSATRSTLTLIGVSQLHAGDYSVTASNIAGATTSNSAKLVVSAGVSGAPVITMQPPANLTATPLSVVLITATASGGGLSYQWLKNGMAINHPRWQAATLKLVAATTNDNASYTLRVTNSAGSVVSSATVLRVKY